MWQSSSFRGKKQYLVLSWSELVFPPDQVCGLHKNEEESYFGVLQLKVSSIPVYVTPWRKQIPFLNLLYLFVLSLACFDRAAAVMLSHHCNGMFLTTVEGKVQVVGIPPQ